MIKCLDWPIAVCTWSLANDLDKIKILTEQTQLSHVHLALAPAMEQNGAEYISSVHRQGLKITATMIEFPQEDYSTLESIKTTGGIVPDQHWPTNKERLFKAVDLTADLEAKYLSFHFGFIDLNNLSSATKLFDRAKILADKAAKNNVQLLMETGQETADELYQFLEKLNHPALAVNFDPANMILYDKGDPLETVKTLAPWIKHVHIKDAIRTQTPGTWGTEVPWDTGQAGGTDFLKALKQINFAGALAIEREGGDGHLSDIKNAVDSLAGFSG